MSVWNIVGLAMAGYLALLARSAWRQGELVQFLCGLIVVLGLIGALAAAVAAYIYLA